MLNDCRDCRDCRGTKFFIFESDEYKGTLRFSFWVCFQAGRYQDEWVSPSIHIQSYETGKAKVEELTGCTYQVYDMEEYSFTILEVSNQMVHIKIEGIAIVDVYADPYETAPFSGDFWLNWQ